MGVSRFFMPQILYQTIERGLITEKTVSAMKSLINDSIRDWRIIGEARKIVSDCDGHDFENEINTIFEFCRDRIRYRRDPVGCELLQSPRRTLIERVGDCDDKTSLFCSLTGAIGHKTRLVLESTTGKNWAHVRADVLYNGKWIAADPTPEFAPLGWTSERVKKRGYVNL